MSSVGFRRWHVDTAVVEDVEDELKDLEYHDDGNAREQPEWTPEGWDQSSSLKLWKKSQLHPGTIQTKLFFNKQRVLSVYYCKMGQFIIIVLFSYVTNTQA